MCAYCMVAWRPPVSRRTGLPGPGASAASYARRDLGVGLFFGTGSGPGGAPVIPPSMANSHDDPHRPPSFGAVGGEPPSIVEMAAHELRRAIVEAALPPGSAMPITELSSRLAVSHIPIREAPKRLES